MKPSDVIRIVNTTKPNAYEDDVKLIWISRCEANILSQIHKVDPDGITPIADREDPDGELTVPSPYDELYPLYIQAQIDYADGEPYLYNLSATVYNAAYTKYATWYIRNNKPASVDIPIYL